MIIWEINKPFINKLPTEIRKHPREKLKELSGRGTVISTTTGETNVFVYSKAFIICCPFCRKFLYTSFESVDAYEHDISACPKCGAIDPFENSITRLQNATIITDLAIVLAKNTPSDTTVADILLEQGVVIIISALEEFLKDVYFALMNITYVKSHRTLLNYFEKSTHNNFIDPGNAFAAIKKDIGIDFRGLMKEDDYKTLILFSKIRHIIVHNSCRADINFLNQTHMPDMSIGDKIYISSQDVQLLNKIVKKLLKNCHKEYNKLIWDDLVQNIRSNGYLNDKLNLKL